MPFPHLAARLLGTPLLLTRAKLDVLLTVLRTHAAGMPLPMASTPAPEPSPRVPEGIAVIPIHGTLVRRTLGLEAASGLTSYAQIHAQIEEALADRQIAGIVLDIDSPGGEAGGVFELADFIRTVSEHQLIWAHVSDCACSAAYAIACAAQRVTLSHTASVGSIGVIALHVDQSVKDANDGLTYTALYAGRHKNDATPHAPLSIEAAATLQAEVDRLYAIFVDHVARMRPIDAQAVRAMEAAVVFGPNAIDAGLADAVGSLEATLAALSRQLQAQGLLAHPPLAKTPLRLSHCSTAQEPSMSSSPSASVQDAALITTVSNPTPSLPIAAENGLTPPQLPAPASAPPTAQ